MAFSSLMHLRTTRVEQSMKDSWLPYHRECSETLVEAPDVVIATLMRELSFFYYTFLKRQKNLEI